MKERFAWLAAIVAALVLSVSTAVPAAQATRVDVTGEWTFSVESAAGTSMPAVTLKQEGQKLTGRYSSQIMGEATITGTVNGQAIDFTVSANVQGTTIELKYTGTIENKDSMKGKLSAGEFGDGTFTAKRKS
jgi:hypothetical protein